MGDCLILKQVACLYSLCFKFWNTINTFMPGYLLLGLRLFWWNVHENSFISCKYLELKNLVKTVLEEAEESKELLVSLCCNCWLSICFKRFKLMAKKWPKVPSNSVFDIFIDKIGIPWPLMKSQCIVTSWLAVTMLSSYTRDDGHVWCSFVRSVFLRFVVGVESHYRDDY